MKIRLVRRLLLSTRESEKKRRVNTFRITCASPSSMPNAAAGSIRASMQVRTRYFFAGGSAREPCVKVELYFSDAASRFFWIAVAIVGDLLLKMGLVETRADAELGRGLWECE